MHLSELLTNTLIWAEQWLCYFSIVDTKGQKKSGDIHVYIYIYMINLLTSPFQMNFNKV